MKDFIKTFIIVVAGNLVYALGVCLFIIPSGLITGGTTGIALIANHAFGISISPVVAVFNIAMFALGFFLLGRSFALNTLISTVFYPLLLGVVQGIVGDFILTDDILLCALFGGLCIGISLAMIIRIGASTGGMDIPPLLLKKFFGIPVSVSLYVFDFIILIGQMFFTSTRESLYGILLVIVYTITLDKLLALGQSQAQLQIVTNYPDKLKETIIAEMDRGVTMLHGQTGYLGIETDVLQCVIAPRELHRMEVLIHSVDPNAFIVQSRVSSVTGRGFSRDKKYLEAV